MKKIICSLIVITVIVLTATTYIFAAGNNTKFSDVTGTEYYAESAEILSELNILAGYPDGSFGAENAITRAEMAAIICRVIEKEENAQTSKGITAFDDVDSNHWASRSINIVSAEGIVNGDGNGKFRPDDYVTYEEAIKMIVCALKFDVNIKVDPKDWSAGYIKVAQNKGITKNLKGSKGNPSTRGDVAVMIHGAIVSDLVIPKASLESGEYVGEQKVLLTTETENADIYYTTNGKEPSINSTKYKKAITISDSCTLKAIAVKKGILVSDTMIERYDIRPETYRLTIDEDGRGNIIAAEGEYEENSKVRLKAVPNDGYEFKKWYSDNGGSFSNRENSECTFTMPAKDVVISANFSELVEEDYTVPIEAESDSSSKDDNNEENEEADSNIDNSENNVSEEKENTIITYVPKYDNFVIPKYDYVTGAKVSINIDGQEVAPLSFSRSNAIITRYFYDSNAEQVEVYKNYLLATGWTLTGTAKGGDSRGQCEKTGYSHKDSNGNTDAHVEINFFPDCGNVDLVTFVEE